jgi:hypothetical protein
MLKTNAAASRGSLAGTIVMMAAILLAGAAAISSPGENAAHGLVAADAKRESESASP